MRLALLAILFIGGFASQPAHGDEEKKSDSTELIEWLLAEDRDLRGIDFAKVLAATSGKKIIPVDPVADSPWLDKLGAILDRILHGMNAPTHPVHTASRINETSRFIEDDLLRAFNSTPGWACRIPKTAAGIEQRSGYPDLRLVLEDGSVVYLDPKLSAAENRNSTLRTFYYEPKTGTGKVHDDARHLIVGITHNSAAGGTLRFTGWDLIDVSTLKVQLKAEFQASNKDMYRKENIIRAGRDRD